MAKITRLLALILLTCSILLAGTNHAKELLSYDKKIITSNNDELLRIHHALKSIYIQSIVSNDEDLKKETLKRLVKTSNMLKLDSLGYTKELATMQKTNPSKIYTKKKLADPVKRISSYSKHLPNLKSISNLENSLILYFDREMSKKDIKSFQLKSKSNIREVFDIRAVLPFVPNIKVPQQLEDLRIAQFNDKTLRVVFQKNSILKSSITVSGTKVELFFDSSKKGVKKAQTTKEYIKSVRLAPSNKIVVIDPGHGGKDPGAVAGKGLYEKTVALAISLKVGEILKKRGYRVYFTRTTDKFIKLRDRTRFANKKNADLFISIHANAAKNEKLNGVETYFLSPARSERSKRVAALENKGDIEEMNYFSKATYLNVFNKAKIVASNKFAIDVQRGMISYLRDSYNVKDGGVREAPFWVLVGAQMPAILVEVGYISNRVEKKRIFTSRYQNLIARGIASGVDNYFLKNR